MSFLNVLQGEKLAIFESYLSPKQFTLNSCILRVGDPGDGCYIIDKGTVRLELQSAETDTDIVIGFLEQGSFLGEFSLLDSKPRSASAFAHTPVKARWFSRENYEEICQHYPGIGLIISTALGQNLTNKLRELSIKTAGYIFSSEIDKDTDIFNSINDAVLLLDLESKNAIINEKTKELTGIKKNKIENLSKILVEYDQLNLMLEGLIKGDIQKFSRRVHLYSKECEKIPVEANFSYIKDKYGEPIGILIQGRELKEMNRLRIEYKLTGRESEIINLLLNGRSNREIADNLGITMNTIKRHITNIYNKLTVNSKIELLYLLKDLNVSMNNLYF